MSQSRRITINGQEFNSGQWLDGVEYEIVEVTGLGMPQNVFTSEQNVAADGAWATTGYQAPRALGFQGVVRAVDEVRAELAWDRVNRLFDGTEFPVTLHYASGDRTIWMRRDGAVEPASRDLPTEFPWSAVCKAVDPAVYAGDPGGSGHLVLTTGLPHADGGLAFPVTFPVTFAGGSATGDLVVELAAGGRLEVRIDGLVSKPQLIVENAIGVFRLAWFAILDAGMWLDIDPQKRSALIQGQASRPPNVRLWPKLAPGVNTIRFRAAEYSASARLTATIRPTL